MRTFRTAFAIVFVAAALLGAAACRTPEEDFVDGIHGYWKVIGPEYESYIDSDPNLKEKDKEIRKDSSKGLTNLINDERTRIKEGKKEE
jgi:hypothetical protein